MWTVFPERCIPKAIASDMLNQHADKEHKEMPLNVLSEPESISRDEYSTHRQKHTGGKNLLT